MKKILVLLLTLMLIFSLVACGEQGDGGKSNKDGEKTNAEDIAKDVLDEAEKLDSFSEAAVEHYLKAYGISYEELKPDWEYTVGSKSAYADDPDVGSGHAVVIFKSPNKELTDEQIQAYYEQVFSVTAKASDDGYNIIGHEFAGENDDPMSQTTLEKALDSFLQGWGFVKDGKNMAVYVSSTYDNDKESALDRLFYYDGVKFDIGVGLQKSFEDTLNDAEDAWDEYEDEIEDAIDNYIN